jgi:hypothetical protein
MKTVLIELVLGVLLGLLVAIPILEHYEFIKASKVNVLEYTCLEDLCTIPLPKGSIIFHETVLQDSLNYIQRELFLTTGEYYIFKPK